MLKRTNIEDKLKKSKSKMFKGNDILEQVTAILKEEDRKEDAIMARMKSIYHVDQIKDICITYRLRFLDTKYFKNEIPYEALMKIKEMEKEHGIDMRGFKIVAPSKLFKLEDADDPLLFAPIGNGYFYLIHKWGNDLNAFRKIWAWNFKTFENLIFSTVIVSILAAYLIPNGIFAKNPTGVEFLLIFFFTFKSIAAMVLYYSFAAGKNFNTAIWNSKYFNA
jgi:hypothetical protein